MPAARSLRTAAGGDKLSTLAAERLQRIGELDAAVRALKRRVAPLEVANASLAERLAIAEGERDANAEAEVRRLTAKLTTIPDGDRDTVWLRAELERTRRSEEGLERENRALRQRLAIPPHQQVRRLDTSEHFQALDRRSSSSKCHLPCPKRGHEHACRETRGHLLDHEWWSSNRTCSWPVAVAIAS